MATLKERSDNWNATSLIHRDHRHDKGDGYEETPHKRTDKKVTQTKKPGCPGNKGKAHVYVWIGARYMPAPNGKYFDQAMPKWAYRDHPSYNPTYSGYTLWNNREEHIAHLESFEIQICAGCLKKSGKKRMLDGAPTNGWYFW
jgi:hypothetical protein